MDYDKTNIPEIYSRGRDHGPAFLGQWMRVVSDHIDEVHDVLDLGCGSGRFSGSLATHFSANVIGIDPSSKMLSEASKSEINRRVFYVRGSAEYIPLPAQSVDLVFISMVFHHFNDSRAVAHECRRVLRENGRVFLRTASFERISEYPYVAFFPSSRPVLEKRLPALSVQRAVFEAASFQTLFSGIVTQVIASNYAAYADKLSLKADSVLASLDDKDFEAGIAALRSAAAGMATDTTVEEPIDVLVFGKST